LGGSDQEDYSSKPTKSETLSQKYPTHNHTHMTGGVAQEVESLPSNFKALSSNFSTAKQKQKHNKRQSSKSKSKEMF
jgi:hypothetical protein